ncbi:UNVERIFIED_CONTAM: hypothetical protein K2H54_059852 [Gekko kuhli]
MTWFAMLAAQTDLLADLDAPTLLSAFLDENAGNKVDNGSSIEQLKETTANSAELILLKGAEEGKGHALEKRVDMSTKGDEPNINGSDQESNGAPVGVNTQATSLEILLEIGDMEENTQ